MEAFKAFLWMKNPSYNPDEIEDWPADKVFRYIRWANLADQLNQELSGNGSGGEDDDWE